MKDMHANHIITAADREDAERQFTPYIVNLKSSSAGEEEAETQFSKDP